MPEVATRIQAVGGRIVLQLIETQDVSESGLLFIPEIAKDASWQGIVIAVADDVDHVEIPVEAGMKVIFGKYSGSEITWEGEKYLFIKATDVLAIIHDDE